MVWISSLHSQLVVLHSEIMMKEEHSSACFYLETGAAVDVFIGVCVLPLHLFQFSRFNDLCGAGQKTIYLPTKTLW